MIGWYPSSGCPARSRDAPLPEHRAGFTGLTVAPYDAAWRFEVEVRTADPTPWDVQTGTDGVVPFVRLGVVALPGLGELDVWRLTSYGGGVDAVVPVGELQP